MIHALIQRMVEKAPAATMFYGLLARIFSDQAIDQIFNDHRQVQVESPLRLSHLVATLTSVVSGAANSVNAAHQSSESAYSRQAFYDKLKGVETPVSAALLRVSTAKLRSIRESTETDYKDVIKGFHTFVIDGKTYNATEHRLLETRTDARSPLPGRAIALLDTRMGMFIDVECDANAHRCERKIAEPLLERQLKAGALYIADRNFCDGTLLEILRHHQAYYIIRQHGVSPSRREIAGEKRVFQSKAANNARIFEQVIEVQLADGHWQKIRRITIRLTKPTRNGDTEIYLLSNLPKRVKASSIANAYQQRWTIENCFGHLSRALNAEIRALCYPGAAGLCFSLALLLFNIMSLIRLLLLKHGKKTNGTGSTTFLTITSPTKYHGATSPLLD